MANDNEFVYGGAESAVQVQAFKFGLNQKCTLQSITYNEDCRGENSTSEVPVEAVDITFLVGEKEFLHRIMSPKGMYVDGVLSTTPENIKKALSENVVMPIGCILECFILPSDIAKAYTSTFPRLTFNFKNLVEMFVKLLPKDFATTAIDLFLQYEGDLREGQTRTYLKLPKNVKQGVFACKHIEGDFKPVVKNNPSSDDANALIYIREDGVKHRFTRNGWFMKSKFASQQQGAGGYTAPDVKDEDISNLSY